MKVPLLDLRPPLEDLRDEIVEAITQVIDSTRYIMGPEIDNLEKEIAEYNNISLPEKFGIDFNEIEYPKTVQDQVAWNDWMLANNMTSLPELYMKYNKDYDIKQAEKKIEENKGLNGTKEETTTGSLFTQARTRVENNK